MSHDLIADLIASAQPRTREVPVCARGDLVDRHARLVLELAAAKSGSLGKSEEELRISREIVAVEEEMEASTVTLVMASVGRRKWADLMVKHPPRKEDKGLDHNPETFPPAMVALCCQSPKMTEAEALALSEVLPVGEWNLLWNAGVSLNVTGTPHPKLPAASELVRANGTSSTTPGPAASPEADSSDDPAGQ